MVVELVSVVVLAAEVVVVAWLLVQEIHQLLLRVKVIVVLLAGRTPVVAVEVVAQAQSVHPE